MNNLNIYLKDMYDACKFDFSVYVDEKLIFSSNKKFQKDDEDLYKEELSIENSNIKIIVFKKDINVANIIKFFLQEKYKPINNEKENVILKLLKREPVSAAVLNKKMPLLTENTYMITLYLENKVLDVKDILEKIYTDTDSIIIRKDDNVVMIGNFEEIKDHISSISETIYTSLYEKSFINYDKIYSYNNLAELYDEALYHIKLAKKYNLEEKVFNNDSLFFEKIIDGLSDQTKSRILKRFSDGFSKLDKELIKTIEIFFIMNLNLSESAKELYVHRNTLIYRLDKIERYTTYDIRKFNDAIIFKMAFCIWKEHNLQKK
ncbi:helix-turn-helix domain-containing protein [Clostridium sp. BJN0001]|uniref:PucR family transcriptional regulator n=1 Tax=Clostridium sp. BJN0001 TaxID=2930219 RepID=UPI001FD44475|nr:helix-turn-helix domain-containing protein [Clostridium sp. BJN0001]